MWEEDGRLDPDDVYDAYDEEDDVEPLRRPSRLVAIVGLGIVVVWVASLVVQ